MAAALAEAPFPVTVVWGLYDTVSPPRVASYVWNEYLMLKPGGNRLYLIPDANHYLQNDRPDAFVKVLLHALEPADDQGPGALEAELGAPLLVDSSRERLPAAADLLRVQTRRPEPGARRPARRRAARALITQGRLDPGWLVIAWASWRAWRRWMCMLP